MFASRTTQGDAFITNPDTLTIAAECWGLDKEKMAVALVNFEKEMGKEVMEMKMKTHLVHDLPLLLPTR